VAVPGRAAQHRLTLAMATPDENKTVVLRQIEALNALAQFVHPDFLDHDSGRATRRLEPLDIVAEDDRVVVRARLSDGSQQIHIWRVTDGLIVEHWTDTREKGAA
jgi:hypothetical protein